jgi:undecaprenyl-diphosphatase
MISTLYAFILGIIEGITEFLPISSTGHLILAANYLKISESNFVKSFEIIIQLGAILAVVFLYGKKLLADKKYFAKIMTAFIPTGIIGFLLYKIIKHYLLGNTAVVAISLLVGGIIIIYIEKYFKKVNRQTKDLSQMKYTDALLIGIIQSISVVPGVSRAASTIIGGLFLGFDRKSIVEFSFLLAIPTMLAATAYDLLKNASSFSADQFSSLAVGFVVAFISAMIAVKWLLKFVKDHDFTVFGVYRVILAIIVYFTL